MVADSRRDVKNAVQAADPERLIECADVGQIVFPFREQGPMLGRQVFETELRVEARHELPTFDLIGTDKIEAADADADIGLDDRAGIAGNQIQGKGDDTKVRLIQS